VHTLQLGIGDGVVDHHGGSRRGSKRRASVQAHSVVGAVGRRGYDDVAARADALLKCAVIFDKGVAGTQCRA